MPKQPLDRRAVTVSQGWRQLALFTRAEIKPLTLSRYQRIKKRLREEEERRRSAKPPSEA